MKVQTTSLFLLFTILYFNLLGCSISKNPCSITINPDISCRVLDEKSDGTKLVEYFNSDTNQFKLMQINPDQEIEIEHPYGKVTNFMDKIESNKIQFDLMNSENLIVNGEKFKIVKK